VFLIASYFARPSIITGLGITSKAISSIDCREKKAAILIDVAFKHVGNGE
jgi:hypothetical protein